MGNDLFSLFTLSFYEDLSNCVNAKKVDYHKGEFISFHNNKNQFAIIKKGEITLLKTDEEGSCYTIEKLTKNDIFTKIWHQDDNELVFVCTSDTEIILIDYLSLLRGCNIKCPRHQNILEIFFKQIINYTTKLNQKLALLQIKKMEDRILTYFRSLCVEGKNSFILPMSYKELADYFMVDRSSFMRKLKDMEERKIIKKEGKKIILLNPSYKSI